MGLTERWAKNEPNRSSGDERRIGTGPFVTASFFTKGPEAHATRM